MDLLLLTYKVYVYHIAHDATSPIKHHNLLYCRTSHRQIDFPTAVVVQKDIKVMLVW
jgi:hypothetical protein